MKQIQRQAKNTPKCQKPRGYWMKSLFTNGRYNGTEEVIVGAGSWALPAKQDRVPKLQKYYSKR